MSKEVDLEYIKSKLIEVLKQAHSDPRKNTLKVYKDRIAMACPICQDSQKDPNKKRCNIYLDNPLFYKCFNEGCKGSVIGLFKKFNVDIDLHKKQEMYDYADSHIKFDRKKETYIPEQLDKLIDIDELANFLEEHPEHNISNFKPIQNNSAQYQYLKFDRLIDNFENIYQCDYHITPRWTEKCIVILNKSGKKMLAMQIRNLKPGDKRLYKIFNFEKLYTILHPNEDVDELEMLSYNKISNFYNILNVNWDETVTLFEGYLDSIFFPNSIGAIGINSVDTELSFLFDAELDLRFFFDQDNVGVRTSLKLLEGGHKVFLWQKLIEKLIEKKSDKYQAKKRVLNIKDLNKLVQEMKNSDAYNKLKLYKYFSNDLFDKLYLNPDLYPKPEFKKYNKSYKK